MCLHSYIFLYKHFHFPPPYFTTRCHWTITTPEETQTQSPVCIPPSEPLHVLIRGSCVCFSPTLNLTCNLFPFAWSFSKTLLGLLARGKWDLSPSRQHPKKAQRGGIREPRPGQMSSSLRGRSLNSKLRVCGQSWEATSMHSGKTELCFVIGLQ